MNYRQAFEDSLSEDRYSVATRLAYADWLTEQGEDDAALEQVRRSSEAWIAADKRMHEFADKCGMHCVEGYGDGRYDETTHTYDDASEKWEKITYDMVMRAAADWLREGSFEERYNEPGVWEWWGGYFTQLGDEDARNLMSNEQTRKQFWQDYQTITGTVVEEIKQGQVFSCSC
jgi:uncharacterized protein (TIGR02996 family)